MMRHALQGGKGADGHSCGEGLRHGSSRDWRQGRAVAAFAVIAVSYERIHRSNLVGMGVLPLEFVDGQDAASLGLDGNETLPSAV